MKIYVNRRWVIVYLWCLFSELDKQSDVHSTEWVPAYRRKHQAAISGLFFGSGFCTCLFPWQHSKAIWLFSQHVWQTGIWCGHVFGLPWHRKACYKNGEIVLCLFSLLDFFNRAAHLLFHTQESVCFYLDFKWVHTIECDKFIWMFGSEDFQKLIVTWTRCSLWYKENHLVFTKLCTIRVNFTMKKTLILQNCFSRVFWKDLPILLSCFFLCLCFSHALLKLGFVFKGPPCPKAK